MSGILRISSVFLIFGLLSLPNVAGQHISPADREKLIRAQRVADEFVDRFRRTLDFGPLWKEFRAEQFSCRLIKSDLVTNVSDEEKRRIGVALLEEAYIATMNYFYLKGAHDLSVARMDSNISEEQISPKEILKAENSSVYTKTNGKSPTTAREMEEYIRALNGLAKLYRKYLPRNVMRSAEWKANIKYLVNREGFIHLGVATGNADLCIPDNVKYFVVDRGLFFFYMIEESGQMRIVDLILGD